MKRRQVKEPDMFPFSDIENWFGSPFNSEIPYAISSLTVPQVEELAEYVRRQSQAPSAIPRPSQLGEVRPHIASMRLLDAFWGPGPLLERVCTALTYASSATIFDPFSFTIEEFALATTTPDERINLRSSLVAAAELLVKVYPLARSGALDFLPPRCTREFAPGLPGFAMDDDLLIRYTKSGLNDQIGEFNRSVGGSHSTGRYRGYQHLWQIHQDLLLVDRHSEVLQPFFLAGFDVELATLVTATSLPTMRHVGNLTAFRFPALQVTPEKVYELRGADEFIDWGESLRIALSLANPEIQGIRGAQAQVHEALLPVAERLASSLKTRWSDLRWTAMEQFIVGGLTAGVAFSAGAEAIEATATGLTGAALTTAWTGWRARGKATNLDVPFLSMLPDNDRNPPVAIPKVGLL